MPYSFGPYQLDLDNATLWQGDTQLILRPKTFDLLAHLVRHAGKLVTKEELMEAVWFETVVSDSALTVSISELRKVLGETARQPQFIATVHRRGYRFMAPVTAEDTALPPSVNVASDPPMTRRLTAILSADAQGYSRLMEHDDEATVHTLTIYRKVMTDLIEQHHGRVVDAPGDNLLAEFVSVLDAVQGAISIQQELTQRNQELSDDRQMWFRIGINLGDVLVDGERLYGDGVNIAARLEGLAEGGGICISGTVYEQIETKLNLVYTALGEQTVKNIVKPVRAYRVEPMPTSAVSAEPRRPSASQVPEASFAVPPPPHLVSREMELDQLHECFAYALQGHRQVVFISGEAGIGKTTLVDTFVSQLSPASAVWIGRGQCIEQYGAGEPYLPLLEAFGQLCRGPDREHLIARLTQQAPSWLIQMPALLSTLEYEMLQRRVAGATHERMLRELAEAVETLSSERLLILMLEDLHWSDVSTLEWLAYVARRRQPARLLVLGTYRPVDAVVREHPVREVAQELLVHGQCQQAVVDSLSPSQVESYLMLRLGPGPLGATLTPYLYQRTNGNSLFLVTMVDEMVRQGMLHEGTAGWELAEGSDVMTMEVPGGIQQLIAQQLERLTLGEQELLEAASVVGKDFTTEGVATCLAGDAEMVESQYSHWARRGQFVRSYGIAQWPDGTVSARYQFIHDLYHEVVYEQIGTSRRRRWHQRIGEQLEASYGDRAPEIATELALHFEYGQDTQRAVTYYRHAAETALQRFAYQETIVHVTKGLALLPSLPTSERLQHELTLQQVLGPVLMATKGYASSEVEQTYRRALELCKQVGERSSLFPLLRGLWNCHVVRAEFQEAHELGEQLLHLAQTQDDDSQLLAAHRALGTTLLWLGELESARAHFEQSIRFYNLEQHRSYITLYGEDPGVISRVYIALGLWAQGYPEQVLQRCREALRMTQQLSHAFSQAFVLIFSAWLHQLCREREWIEGQADEGITQFSHEN